MSDRQVSVSRHIAAAPEAIFDLLADPSRHTDFDGSGTVGTARGTSTRLGPGSSFRIDMKLGPIPYRISNTVVEFDENRLIAWAHFGGHRWRYRLDPTEGGTNVTETFDWSTSRIPWLIERRGYPETHPAAMTATLERLAALVEN